MLEVQPTLSEVQAIARQAGKILLSRFGQTHQVHYKSAIDPVTEADKLSEASILEAIRTRFPDHRIVSEETGTNHKTSPYRWIVDPLDGTVNFAHGIPIFSVSIAFTIEDEITLAAVFDPSRDEMFSAEKGRGAFLNGQPIEVAGAETLIQSLLVTGFPYDMATTKQDNLKNYGNLARQSQGVRRLGSAALDCCYVASGRFDGYWELFVQPWDVAAGILIVKEAGGVITQVDGSVPDLNGHTSILCSNSYLYQHLFKVLNGGNSL
jgi:myo-inositol-1(or 4)-monophosphatase